MNTLFLVVRLIRRRWFLFALNMLSHIARMGVMLVPALAIRACLDILTGEAEADWSYHTWVLVLLASQVGRYLNVFVYVAVGNTLVYDLGGFVRQNLTREILRRPGADALLVSSGQTISRFRDDVDEVTNLVKRMNDMTGRIVFVASSVAIMLSISSEITLYVIGPMFAFSMFVYLFGRRVQRYHLRARQAAERVGGLVGEIFGSVQAVQVADAADSLVEELAKRNDARKVAAVRSRMLWEGLQSVSDIGLTVGMGAILLFAAQSTGDGSFTIGDMVLFIEYLQWVVGLTGHIGDFILEYKRTGVSLDRLGELVPDSHKRLLVSTPEASFTDITTQKIERTPSLRVRGLTYMFGASENGIRDVNLEVVSGGLTVITGGMGSGKTTLLRTILGLLPAQSGEVLWDDEVVLDPAQFFVPPRCAYVSQMPRLFSGPLRENIALGLDVTEDQILNAVRDAVLDRDVDDMREGLDAWVGPRGLRLSGGQVQRTAMARALVRDTNLLVLDDLSSALDVVVEQAMLDRLLEGGRTILAVSHRPRVLERADHVVLVQEGRVVAQGGLKTLLESHAEMKRLWTLGNE